MIYKGRCKAMKSWKFSRCVSWARHLSFPKLASAAYPCFQHFMCISNEPAISSWVSCIAWKMKNVSSCAYEMCSVPVMWWELDMWKKRRERINFGDEKSFFHFKKFSLVCLFFSLSRSAAVVVLLRKWNLVEFETWWVDIKGKKEKEKMKETITQHMEKHKWIIVVSSLLGWLWPFLLLLLLALPKKNEKRHTQEKRLRWEKRKMRTEKKK